MQMQNTSKGDKSITNYLIEVKCISDQLTATNKPFVIKEMNSITFQNLRLDYNDIVVALATKSEVIQFHELHRLLLSHELQLKNATSFVEANLNHTGAAVPTTTPHSGLPSPPSNNNQPSY
ncbi:hypothetical protein NE237_031945 [Protea cynaroides]|uniref:Uncharacterized protein n=1 Tax=Protea cynaroides TaxID=273540 RepID=A0A9Q0L267_9MAGN|nr:hypothetical protein NE237_031945 [Protea cynaroides]